MKFWKKLLENKENEAFLDDDYTNGFALVNLTENIIYEVGMNKESLSLDGFCFDNDDKIMIIEIKTDEIIYEYNSREIENYWQENKKFYIN